MKVVTPRVDADDLSGGGKRFTVRDGAVVELGHDDAPAGGAAGGASHFGVHTLDPAQVKRHHDNLRRFRFMDRPTRPRTPFE